MFELDLSKLVGLPSQGFTKSVQIKPHIGIAHTFSLFKAIELKPSISFGYAYLYFSNSAQNFTQTDHGIHYELKFNIALSDTQVGLFTSSERIETVSENDAASSSANETLHTVNFGIYYGF